MILSRMMKACRVCQYKDSCNHKRMEAFAYLPEPSSASLAVTSTSRLEAHVDQRGLVFDTVWIKNDASPPFTFVNIIIGAEQKNYI